MKKLTQCDKTLEYITPLDALREYGCRSLPQRIFDLKKLGHSIITELVSQQGMFGKVNFAEYHLKNSGE